MKALLVFALLFVSINAKSYCPSANDFVVTYGSPKFFDQGWSHQGSGGMATKAAFNLIGGSVEYDIDFSRVHTGVNGNVYTISPRFSGSFTQAAYCDGQKSGNDWCVEVDWIETNGNCGGQTTLHTRPGTGSNGCTGWGCESNYKYNGKTSFHMKITYDGEGKWTTYRDGQVIGPNSLSPQPQGQDWQELKKQYVERGAIIYSSLWTGWVPLNDCGTSGDLGSSSYTVKNLRIEGSVVNGPEPRGCSGAKPPSNPPPSGGKPPSNPPPSGGHPPPPPPPAPGSCKGVSLAYNPNDRNWVELNAPQNAHVYVVCTNGGQHVYLSCNWFNNVKWQCPPPAAGCAPNSESGRFAVVNNQWCPLNSFVAHAVSDEEMYNEVTETVEEVFDAAVLEESFDAVSEESFDAAVDESDSFAMSEESVDVSYAAGAPVDSLDSITDPVTPQTSAGHPGTPGVVVAAIVVFAALAVVLVVVVVLTGLRFRKL